MPNEHAAEGALPIYTSVAAWLARDIPDPDFLLGELLSTTSRAMIVADTGLGKTNFAMAAGCAVAEGAGFLHWRGRGKPTRVLLIEGEMSRRLVKRRLADMTRRAGNIPVTFYVVSRSDPRFADMPPLNTAEGQKYIDAIIEQLGGVDFIIFDNIQALIGGDMKDEVPWQETLPWIRELTNREIGQLWIHHTGHDATRSYGTKTREWQLDTVIVAEETPNTGADIAFTLRFTKNRERTPENRADFEAATIRLAEDQWTSEVSDPKGAKLPPVAKLWHDALLDALSRTETPNKTTKAAWFVEAARTGLAEPIVQTDNPAGRNKKTAIQRKYIEALRTAKLIGVDGDTITLLRKF